MKRRTRNRKRRRELESPENMDRTESLETDKIVISDSEEKLDRGGFGRRRGSRGGGLSNEEEIILVIAKNLKQKEIESIKTIKLKDISKKFKDGVEANIGKCSKIQGKIKGRIREYVAVTKEIMDVVINYFC